MQEKKKIIAYIVNPNESVESQKATRLNAFKHGTELPALSENEEVVEIKPLNIDQTRKEVFFMITMTTQSHLRFCKVSWSKDSKPIIEFSNFGDSKAP